MSIRKAVEKDINAISRLWHEMMIFHVDHDEVYKVKANAEELYSNFITDCIKDEKKGVFVYESGEEVLGYIFVGTSILPPIYEDNKIGFIMDLSVTSAKRRTGIGEQLVHFVENWFVKKGINRVECIVSINNPLSVPFWEKHGYTGYSKRHFKMLNTSD